MLKLLGRIVINAVSIWAASQMVPGVTLDLSDPVAVGVVALVFGLVNAFLKPIAKFFSFPFIIFTLGLFTLVINGALFALTAWLTDALSVSGVVAALVASVVVSIVSWFMGIFLDDDDDD